MMHICEICGNRKDNRIFSAREHMLGLQDVFEYLECDRCGCFQLLDPPTNWSRYYPADYYSFQMNPDRPIKRLLKRWRAKHALGRSSLAGAVLVRLWGPPPFTRWIAPANLRGHDSILDVGSGVGQVILDMNDAGFSNLTGIDLFIPADLLLGSGVRVLKRSIYELEGLFDFVMINHSFEHMDDPRSTLLHIARLLRPGHILLISLPLAGKYAWRKYESYWAQLDAPRHLFLHTEETIRLLARETGFTVREVHYDSTAFQFWGSEQYRRQIPLHDQRSYLVHPRRSVFTKDQISGFERKANELNQQRDGDQASFYLVRQ